MDIELIRFRIDAELRRKAERVCSELGLDLTDILRILITQIARDGALPFALGHRIPDADADAEPANDDLQGALWSTLKPQIDAELAVNLLVSFIADCSARLDDAKETADVDTERVARLTRDRDEALELHRRLNVADPIAVDEVIATYSTARRRD